MAQNVEQMLGIGQGPGSHSHGPHSRCTVTDRIIVIEARGQISMQATQRKGHYRCLCQCLHIVRCSLSHSMSLNVRKLN
jgi:hypothetical protein